jgi:FlxA-like protein
MTAAIGISAVASSAAGSGSSPVALQAQLDRYTKQLGDWVSCPSGKTAEGQKIIQALEQQISGIKAQIANQGNSTAASGTSSSTSTRASAPPLATFGTLGTLLNAVA